MNDRSISPRRLSALRLLAALLLVAPAPLACAAEPILEKINLYEGGVGGAVTYRIPGIVVTNKGTVLAYCEARKSSRNDWSDIEVQLCRSTDCGKTWDSPRRIGEPVPLEHVAQARKLR